jgi:hypothetical protein
MSTKMQRIFAWSGPVMMILFFIGFEIAHFVPPPSPKDGAASITSFFQHHATSVRIGMFIAGTAAALIATWSVAISLQLKRISPKHSGYAYAELILGALLIVEFVIPIGIWEGIAFRPTTGSEITLRLNDVASLMFIGVVATAVLEAIVVGIAILVDKRPVPVFPRWVGWSSIVLGLTFFPGGFCVFTKTGPIAWNGAVSWWLALTTFSLWFVALTWGVLKAIQSQEREETAVYSAAEPATAGAAAVPVS